MSSETVSTDKNRRRAEAAEWFALLHDDRMELTSDNLQSWRKWIADPDNRVAFDAITDIWRRAGDIPQSHLSREPLVPDDGYDGSISVAEWQAQRRPDGDDGRSSRSRFRFSLFALAAVLVLAVGLGYIALRSETGDAVSPTAVQETGSAEHRDMRLEDGSLVSLGAKTSVSVHYTETTRTVVLSTGEALFKVAREPRRPFRVVAGPAVITAVGTAFNVRRREEQTVVTVTEGTVDIVPSKEAGSPVGRDAGSSFDEVTTTLRLTAGQQVSYDAEGNFGPVRQVEPQLVVAWRDGHLEFRREPLRNVIPEVNRYSRRQIILSDRAAGELLFTGTVHERRIDEWIASLEVVFPSIEVTETDTEYVLVRTRKRRSQDESR